MEKIIRKHHGKHRSLHEKEYLIGSYKYKPRCKICGKFLGHFKGKFCSGCSIDIRSGRIEYL